MSRTKIVCTLGFASHSEEVIEGLVLAGMDVARFNFSHGSHETHRAAFDKVVAMRRRHRRPVATLLDTKGPEVRLGSFREGSAELEAGDRFTLTTEAVEGDAQRVSVSFAGLPQDLHQGDAVLIDDGLIELRVLSTTDTEVACEVVNGGPVSDRKSVNLPGVHISMPYMSEQDRSDILFGIETGYDFVAASFARSAEDILEVRRLLRENGGETIRIIAKIENAEGVENIDEILRVSDGIMVARGDMGVEIPFEEVPPLQKILIRKAYNTGKMVITATQMLDSMIKNPRPTRAEATDVANAIYDGTSAIMLSGETAAGLYPIKAVQTMALIAERTERDIDYRKRFESRGSQQVSSNVTNAISHATCTTAHDLGAAAILAVTISGHTARMVSKYRPAVPIIGCTTNPQTRRQLSMSWGVTPLEISRQSDLDTLFTHAVERAEEEGLVRSGDLVVITTGVPLGISGTTNLLKVQIAGDVLLRGEGIGEGRACATLCVARSPQEALANFKPGDILVIASTDNSMMPLLKNAAGIVVEQEGADCHAAVAGLALEIPVLVGAANATNILKSGTIITLDAQRGAVHNSAGETGAAN